MTPIIMNQIEDAEKKWLELWKQGPTRLRWTKAPLQIGDPAPDFSLPNTSGEQVHLHDLWQDGPVLILFWRHYGCSCGFDRAARLREEYDSYAELGATVVIIGQAEVERSALYEQKHALPCPVLCDPALRVYRAYDLLEGKPSQIVFDAPDEYLKVEYEAGVQLLKARHGTDKAVVDSPWQMPGEFVIDQTGIVRLAYRYQHCEDWPNPLVLVAAIKEANAI